MNASAKPAPPVLTLVGVGIVVVGLIVSSFFILQLTRAIPGSPTPVDGRPLQLDGVGLTIFSTTRDADQACTAEDANGNQIPLRMPARHEQWDAGNLYYVIAHSVGEVPAQTIEVACPVTDADYFVGRRHTADVFLTPALAALAAFFVPAAVGVVLIILDQRRRRTSPRSPR